MGKKFTSSASTPENVVLDTDSVTEVEEVEATTSEKESIETPEISVEVDESPKKADRLVAIKVSRKYSCSIGGNRYFFEPNKKYNVPLDVKSVLMREPNLLLPL